MVDSTHGYMMERVAIDTIGAAMSNDQITEFRIGSVLGRSLGVLGNNLVPFGVLSIMVLAPQFVLPFLLVSLFGETVAAAVSGTLSVLRAANLMYLWPVANLMYSLLVANLMFFLLSAVLMYGTIGELRGNRVSIGQSIRWVLGLWFPILGVSIVATLGVTAGMLLLVVPGFILLTIWWVAEAAAVVERAGVVESLRRSARLTSGHRWGVFGILIILEVAQPVLQYLANLLLGDMAILGSLISFAITVVMTAFYAVAVAVCYHDLRVLVDGVDIDEIARVFE